MTQNTPENIADELFKLGYIEDETVGDKETVRFFVFKQTNEDDIPTVIIAIYYLTTVTMKNSNFIFREGHTVMLKHLNDTEEKQDDTTKVAFLLILSEGMSRTMLTIHTITSGLTKITDKRLRPNILYTPHKNSSIQFLEGVSKLAKKTSKTAMEISFSEKSIIHAHEEALQKAT